ncbi:Aste57867_13313 [Aphanomyces stellatus]|uniref:Aste57867_13313 protein n=1 Tax=Aphanomyces stellatus TaxID=120398 RepID=A0A485KYA7_9STRA|nr:hypothetical protein As57867_013264 [Aphanomyces stellatus]VFT90152.1 Aste57867_13313 [Aphanomyces stellatus]
MLRRQGGWKRSLPKHVGSIWMCGIALTLTASAARTSELEAAPDAQAIRDRIEARNKASRERAAQSRQFKQQTPPSTGPPPLQSPPSHSISKWNRFRPTDAADVLDSTILSKSVFSYFRHCHANMDRLRVSVASGTQMGKRTYHEDRVTAVSFESPTTVRPSSRSLVSHLVHDVQQEPLTFVAVYDGHGGTQCASFMQKALHVQIKQHLTTMEGSFRDAPLEALRAVLNDACRHADAAFLQSHVADDSGSCGVFALVGQDKWGNVGDSQVLVSRNGRAIDLCVAHSPNYPDERARILAAGGSIVQDRYIFGYLGVSRSFGDRFLKIDRPVVISTPDVVSCRRRPDDEFLLLACDGLFEVFSPQDAVDFVAHHITINQMSPQAICDLLVQTAIENGSQDNVSVVLVMFD